MLEERYRLVIERIGEIKEERTVPEKFQDYFTKMSDFVMMLHELKSCIEKGEYRKQKSYQ